MYLVRANLVVDAAVSLQRPHADRVPLAEQVLPGAAVEVEGLDAAGEVGVVLQAGARGAGNGFRKTNYLTGFFSRK